MIYLCTVHLEMMPFLSKEIGEFHDKNPGVSRVEAICAKRKYVIFTNFTQQVS